MFSFLRVTYVCCVQLFTVPIHEALDTQLQRLDEGMFSRYNLTRRFFARGLIFGLNVFVTALFPFMGDFVNLFGSFALFPLTFMFPSMLVLKARTALATARAHARPACLPVYCLLSN